MKRILSILVFIAITIPLFAQTSAGTRFWCGFMENVNILFNDDPVFRFEIETTIAINGTISVPATGFSLPIIAPANTITQVTLPNEVFYTEGSEIIDNKGILITSDAPVRVSAFHNRAYFSESTHLLPEEELGTEYIVTCYRDDFLNSPSSFVIVSTTDNNEIEIIPSVLTEGLRPAGVPFTVTLNAGENYQVKASGDLTGTAIQSLSNDKIAVFSGAQQANIEVCNGGADSHLYDQSIPVDQWDDLYYFVPFKGQGGDPVRVTAAENNTAVFFDCNQVATLNKGEYYTEKRLAPTVITATRPIAVSQFNSSQGCNPSGVGDPNMLRLHPPSRPISSVQFFSSDETSGFGFQYFSDHFVNVIIPTEDIGVIQIDGTGFATAFAPFSADPNYSFAQLDVSAGIHQLAASAPFLAYSYGFGDFDAYTTHLGFSELIEPEFACLDIQIEGTLCVDSVLTFSPISNLEIASWAWSFGDGNTASEENPTNTYLAPGNYEVILSVVLANGGEVSTSITVAIVDCSTDPCAIPQTVTIIPDDNTCLGDLQTFSLDASFDIDNQQWSLDGQVVGSAAQYSTIFEQPGTYQLRVVVLDAFDCQWTATLNVTPENCGDCQLANDQELQYEGSRCVDSTLQFFLPFDPDFAPPQEITWTLNGQTTSAFNPSVLLTEPGLFIVEFFATDVFGCIYTGALGLQIDDCENDDPCLPQPTVSIVPNGTFCTDQPMTFTATSDVPLIDYSWIATNGAATIDPTFFVTFEEAGVFSVQLNGLNSDGCAVSATLTFEIESCTNEPCENFIRIQPPFDLCGETPIPFSFLTNTTIETQNWTLSNGEMAIGTNPEFSLPLGTTTIFLEALATNGCAYSDTIFLDITTLCNPPELCAVGMPNAFSPNDDGNNDRLVPVYKCPPLSFKMQIFDRWGGLLFETQNLEEGWDGTVSGRNAEMGVYVWVINYQLQDGTPLQDMGDVILMR